MPEAVTPRGVAIRLLRALTCHSAERLVLSKTVVQQCHETRSVGQKQKLATVDQLLLGASVAFRRWPPNEQGLPFARLSGH